jgi:hypothetical protein
MGNFSKDAGTDAKADKNLKTSGTGLFIWHGVMLWCVFSVVREFCMRAYVRTRPKHLK